MGIRDGDLNQPWIFLHASLSIPTFRNEKDKTELFLYLKALVSTKDRGGQKINGPSDSLYAAHMNRYQMQYCDLADFMSLYVCRFLCSCFLCSSSLGKPLAVKGIDCLFSLLPTCELRLSAPLSSKG